MKFEQNGMVCINQMNITDQSFHWHDEMELLLVLDGNIELKVGYELLQLHGGDIMLINSDEIHSIKNLKGSAQVIFVYMDCNACYKRFPDIYEIIAIWCYTDAFEKLNANKNLIFKNVNALAQAMNESSSRETISEHFEALLKSLIYCYRIDFMNQNESMSQTTNEKINVIYRIIKYIYSNYDHKVNLQDISEQEYINLFHLSHSFKDITGYSFRDWLNFVRAEQAEKMLLQTSLSLSEIAYRCGFSDIRYLNKHFQKWYQISPSKYRNTFKPAYEMVDQIKEYNALSSLNNVVKNLSAIIPTIEIAEVRSETILLDPMDCGKPEPISMSWKNELICNYSWFNDQRNLKKIIILKNEIGFTSITLEELFTIELASTHHAQSVDIHNTLVFLLDNFQTVSIQINYSDINLSELKTAQKYLDIFHQLKSKENCGILKCCLNPIAHEPSVNSEELAHFTKILTSIGIAYYFKHAKKSTFSQRNANYIYHMTNAEELHVKWFFSKQGFKNNLYYSCLLFSRLCSNIVKSNDNYIITNEGNDFKILIFGNKLRKYIPFERNYNVILKTIPVNYKFVHYNWNFADDIISTRIKNADILQHLSSQEYDILDNLSYPEVSFDYIQKDTSYETTITLLAANMHLLEFTAL